ncbi:MAG TPA: hypothetical protein VGC57_14915 [Cellulomonas sp.]
MSSRPVARSVRLLAAIAASTALIAACAGAPGSSTTQEADAVQTAPAAGPQPSIPAITLPDQRLDAGAVSTGAPVTLTGEDAAVVEFSRGGELGVVARVDCSACTGDVTLTDVVRGVELGAGPAPLSGTYLVDPHKDDGADRQLLIEADGPWTVELMSWFDLPVLTGPQQGTGAAVLRLGDTGAGLQWALVDDPSVLGLSARAVPESGLGVAGSPGMAAFGSDEPGAFSVQVSMPGLVALSTNGSWTVAVG